MGRGSLGLLWANRQRLSRKAGSQQGDHIPGKGPGLVPSCLVTSCLHHSQLCSSAVLAGGVKAEEHQSSPRWLGLSVPLLGMD